MLRVTDSQASLLLNASFPQNITVTSSITFKTSSSTTLFIINPNGTLSSEKNTLDDGNGNVTINGQAASNPLTVKGGGTAYLIAGAGGTLTSKNNTLDDASGNLVLGGTTIKNSAANTLITFSQSNANLTFGNNISVTGLMANYKGIATVGMGTPPVYGQGKQVAITTATTMATYLPATVSSFIIFGNVSIKTAATVTVSATWTDPNSGAQNAIPLINAVAESGNTTASFFRQIDATTAQAIVVAGTSTAVDTTASATIEQLST